MGKVGSNAAFAPELMTRGPALLTVLAMGGIALLSLNNAFADERDQAKRLPWAPALGVSS